MYVGETVGVTVVVMSVGVPVGPNVGTIVGADDQATVGCRVMIIGKFNLTNIELTLGF